MSKSILVIDDDCATTDLLETVLSTNNFKVHTANSGIEGVQAARDIAPDIVVVAHMFSQFLAITLP